MALPPSISRVTCSQSRTASYSLKVRKYSVASKAQNSRPFYPSVQLLLHQHKLDPSSIQGTGPNGRLLKGDVLAYLSVIPKGYPSELAVKLEKRSHLDVSYKLPAPASDALPSDPAAVATEPQTLDQAKPVDELYFELPIDLTPALRLQRKLQDAFGTAPSLAILVKRAVTIANEGLPAYPNFGQNNEGIFDLLVGQYRPKHSEDGRFVPKVNHFVNDEQTFGLCKRLNSHRDVFDDLIDANPTKRQRRAASRKQAAIGAVNEFSVLVGGKENRKRATTFLQRLKSLLEVEPGRLVF